MFLQMITLFVLFLQPTLIHTENWAVLVAGAKYENSVNWNYGLQADVCHAYQILRQHGIPEDHIITMMWDDIAHNAHNLHAGKLYNNPNGSDVYSGVKIDYRGKNVSTTNFLSVLQGKPNADGPVLKSTSNDKVFVFLTSHGDPGTVEFEDGDLTVMQVTNALKAMHKKGMYKELVFYLDSCFSGSMFSNETTKQLNVYAATSAPHDDYASFDYCRQSGYMNNSDDVCLGSVFSVSWLEFLDKQNDLQTETLEQQWNEADNRTLHGDGDSGQISYPEQFGNLAITGEKLSEFFGAQKVQQNAFFNNINKGRTNMYKGRQISKFDAPLYAAKTEAERQEILKQRSFVDEQMGLLARTFARQFGVRNLFAFPTEITQLECHDQVTHFFRKNCPKIPRKLGVFRHSQIFANVCEQRIDTARIISVLKEFCLQD